MARLLVQAQLLIAFTLCLQVLATKWEDRAKIIRNKYEEIKRNCTEEQQMSESEVLDYDTHMQPESYKEKCLLACVLEGTGIMTDGKFNRAGSDELSGFMYQDTPNLASAAREVSRKCEKSVESLKMDDECETAHEIYLCVRKVSKQMGIKN